MKIFINLLTVVGLTSLFLILGFLFLITWRIPVHNFNLWQLNKNFELLSTLHPLSSKILLKFSDFGNFGESGGQCGYVIGEFHVSQLTKEEIYNHYKNAAIKSFRQGEIIPLEVLFLNDDNFAHYPWSKWLSYLQQKFNLSMKSSFIVYLVIAGSYNHVADGDIRCYLSK